MSSSISILIPSWNGLHLLLENLPSVCAAAERYDRETGSETEILVVDDGSEDNTGSQLIPQFPRIRLILRQQNAGFAIACNTGFSQCRFPLVALLNNDVWISEDYFLHQAAHFQNPRVFAVTAKVFEWEQPVFGTGGKFAHFRKGFWSVYFNYDVNISDRSIWVKDQKLLSAYGVGGFSTYSKVKLKELGGFNQLLSPFYWEDIDLSYRGWKRGWEIHYEPRSIARHRTSATINTRYRKKLVKEIATRNRLLFHWINLHSPTFLARHLLMFCVLLFTRILVLDFSFYRACFQALRKLSMALDCRREEKIQAV